MDTTRSRPDPAEPATPRDAALQPATTRTLGADALAEQLRAASGSALLLPRPELAVLEVRGGDRQSWLNGLVTCDLANRRVGDAVYGLAVEKKGRIVADLVVLFDEARLLVAVPEEKAEELRAAFDHYLIMEHAEIARAAEAFAAFDLHGPKAGDMLAVARAAGALGGLLDRTGAGGAFLLLPVDREADIARALDAALVDAGGARGDATTWEALRLERAVPRFGVDFGTTTYPQEAGLEKAAVSFSKGCYLGQEVVCMLELRGQVKRKLAQLELEGTTVPAPGTPVFDAGEVGAGGEAAAAKAVGEVTSAGRLPDGRTLALAMVKRALVDGRAALRVGEVAARVLGPANERG